MPEIENPLTGQTVSTDSGSEFAKDSAWAIIGTAVVAGMVALGLALYNRASKVSDEIRQINVP